MAVEGSVAAGVGGDASPAAGVSVGAVLLGLFPGLLLTHPSPGAERFTRSSCAQVRGEHPLPPNLSPPPAPPLAFTAASSPPKSGLPALGGWRLMWGQAWQRMFSPSPPPCQGAACSYMGKRGEPGKCDSRLRSCLFLHCLCLFSGASQLALEPPLPRLRTARAHRGPNNAFIRTETVSPCCLSFSITLGTGPTVGLAV